MYSSLKGAMSYSEFSVRRQLPCVSDKILDYTVARVFCGVGTVVTMGLNARYLSEHLSSSILSEVLSWIKVCIMIEPERVEVFDRLCHRFSENLRGRTEHDTIHTLYHGRQGP